jgi:hypothetical protein
MLTHNKEENLYDYKANENYWGVELKRKMAIVICMAVIIVSLVSAYAIIIQFHTDIIGTIIFMITIGAGVFASLILIIFISYFEIERIKVTRPDAFFQSKIYKDLLIKDSILSQDLDAIKVLTSRKTTLRIYVQPGYLILRTGLTPSMWSLVYLFVVIGITAPIVTIAIVYSILKSYDFIEHNSFNRIVADKNDSYQDRTVNNILQELLLKGYLIVKDARDAARSNYQDVIILGICVAMIFWAEVFANYYTENSFILLLIYSLIFAIILLIPFIFISIYYIKPKIKVFESWKTRITQSIIDERIGNNEGDQFSSKLELLIQIAQQIPSWKKYGRRAGYLKDPGSWLLIAVLLSFALFSFSSIALMWLGGIAIAFLLAFYIKLRSNLKKKDEIVIKDWNTKLSMIQSQILETPIRQGQ